MDSAEWARLIRATEEINDLFDGDIAFIGGVAIYAHAVERQDFERLAVFSHDADLVIMLHAFADLRDIEVLTPNRRLGKQQFEKDGFEFDVYVQHQTDLRVPVEEIVAASEVKSGLRTASLEHLLILKIDALRSRAGSQKGEKDAHDVIRILYLLENPVDDRLCRLTSEDLGVIDRAITHEHILGLVAGNSHLARSVRERVEHSRSRLLEAIRGKDHEDPAP